MVKTNGINQKVREDFIIPSADIFENDNEFILKAEMPGVSKDQLDITLDEDHLEIIGKVDADWEKDLKVIDREFRISDYYRRFYVGNKVNRDEISAKIEDGVLTLRLPKSNEIKPRKIEITSE